MPIRIVVLFNLGPPFRSFRAAVQPGMLGLDFPEGFAALEKAIGLTYTLLAAHHPESWPAIAGDAFDAAVPRLGDRDGVVDAMTGATENGELSVVLRACFRFRFWPLGGWVVYEGRYRASDGTWRAFSDEELSEVW